MDTITLLSAEIVLAQECLTITLGCLKLLSMDTLDINCQPKW